MLKRIMLNFTSIMASPLPMTILYIAYRNDQVTTSAKSLDIVYEPYGFNADLIEVIN